MEVLGFCHYANQSSLSSAKSLTAARIIDIGDALYSATEGDVELHFSMSSGPPRSETSVNYSLIRRRHLA
jgi:hypothetical protein